MSLTFYYIYHNKTRIVAISNEYGNPFVTSSGYDRMGMNMDIDFENKY